MEDKIVEIPWDRYRESPPPDGRRHLDITDLKYKRYLENDLDYPVSSTEPSRLSNQECVHRGEHLGKAELRKLGMSFLGQGANQKKPITEAIVPLRQLPWD